MALQDTVLGSRTEAGWRTPISRRGCLHKGDLQEVGLILLFVDWHLDALKTYTEKAKLPSQVTIATLGFLYYAGKLDHSPSSFTGSFGTIRAIVPDLDERMLDSDPSTIDLQQILTASCQALARKPRARP